MFQWTKFPLEQESLFITYIGSNSNFIKKLKLISPDHLVCIDQEQPIPHTLVNLYNTKSHVLVVSSDISLVQPICLTNSELLFFDTSDATNVYLRQYHNNQLENQIPNQYIISVIKNGYDVQVKLCQK